MRDRKMRDGKTRDRKKRDRKMSSVVFSLISCTHDCNIAPLVLLGNVMTGRLIGMMDVGKCLLVASICCFNQNRSLKYASRGTYPSKPWMK